MVSGLLCVRAVRHCSTKNVTVYSSQRPKTLARVQIRNQRLIVKASAEELDQLPEPADARGAIALGLKLCEAKRFEDAQVYFERALSGELPGTGIKRFRDKPRLISDGEKIACLYNIACCQAQMGETKNGLIALAGCLEAGYTDFRQVRTDPDLEPLRKDEKFEGLLQRFEKKGGFMGLFKSM